jgi:CheY-like chemotaxis protein
MKTTGLPRLDTVRVLVVDDDADSRVLATLMLEPQGALVTTTDGADRAFALLPELRPHVLLSDLQMPDRDGLWLIRAVRALAPAQGGLTPAACLTGQVDPDTRAAILRAGFQYHIPKPVHLPTLVGIVAILALKP